MSAVVADVVAARVPERSWRSELRAVKIICRRELTRFIGDRAQIMMALIQPLLFLFVLGSGLQSLSAASTHGVDLKTFILGKCLGGAIIAASQGVLVLALAGLVDVPYDPGLILGVFGLLLLLAFAVAAFGLLVAVSIKQAQTFTSVMQLFLMPMFFASGALYPVSGLPAWLGVLNRLDPLTYAVDPIRHLVFNHLDVSEPARRTLEPGVTWWGWHLPPWVEVAMVLALGLAMMAVAVQRFARTE
jgi:ABC-2 type transport system permease protein